MYVGNPCGGSSGFENRQSCCRQVKWCPAGSPQNQLWFPDGGRVPFPLGCSVVLLRASEWDPWVVQYLCSGAH